MVDRRRQHPVDVSVTRLYMAKSLRIWRGARLASGAAIGAAERPLQDRLFNRYEKGLHVPRDCPGGFIDRMEEVVPGTAAFIRSPAWAIVKDRSPDVAALRAQLARSQVDPAPTIERLRTFSELEALLVKIELSRAEGDHETFAKAVASLAVALPAIGFLPEIEPEKDVITAAIEERLRDWRVDAEERRARGLLGRRNDPMRSERHDGGALSLNTGSGPSVPRLLHLLASLSFLALASLAIDPFSTAVCMLMATVHGLLATPHSTEESVRPT